MRLIVGEVYGLSSPIKSFHPMFYIDVTASIGSTITRPHPCQETAVFPVSGQVSVNGSQYGPGEFILLDESDKKH